LPLIVVAIALPIVAAFEFTGPGGGLAVGAIAAATILFLAARATFDEPIEVASAPADRFTMLVVVTTPLEDPALAGAIGEIAAAGTKSTRPGAEQKPEVLVLAPATNSAFAHWLSDLRKARFDAQRRLTLSLAALASVDVDARGTVGNSDTVQAVEDTLDPCELEVAVARLPTAPGGLAYTDDSDVGLLHELDILLQPVMRHVFRIVRNAV